MDLSLSADLDSSLLNWSEAVADMSAAVASGAKKSAPPAPSRNTNTSGNGEPSQASATAARGTANGDGMVPLTAPGFMRLPSFHLDGEAQNNSANNTAVSHRKGMANVETLATQGLPAPATKALAQQSIPTNHHAWPNPQFSLPPHLFPQLVPTATMPMPNQEQQGSSSAILPATLPQHLVIHPFMPVLAQAGAVPNLAAANAAYNMGALSAAFKTANQQAATAQQQAASGVQQPAVQAQQQNTTRSPQHQVQPLAVHSSAAAARFAAQGSTFVPMMFNPLLGHNVAAAAAAANTGFMPMLQQQMMAASSATQTARQQAAAAPQIPAVATSQPANTSHPTNTTSGNSRKDVPSSKPPAETPPPFLLFDAPCELRTNFIQSQRMHGLPVTEDNNSYHYGMAVNGFHPQVNAQDNPIIPLNHAAGGMQVQLVDGRHHKGKRGGARERNEREQKRAQKITELIEKLRVSIEKGGWRVEMKSKYHTLTTCADYVKHLIKTTQEKEAAVEQAKLDLTVKECKLAEDKAQLEGRSDPESVTSSLTASTTGSVQPDASDKEQSGSDDGKKRRAAITSDEDAKPSPKKARFAKVSQSTDSSSGEEGGSGGPGGKHISLNKMSSSVSEMTDSNKGSSERTDGDGSISSTAAVVRGEGSSDRPHGHADVVVKEKRSHGKRKRQELTSLEPNFELDYEDVFLTSNVPQLIASPTGKIVVWNKFFLKATGLTKEDAEGMTIFSIVQAEKLSNLFEMIAQALKRESSSCPENEASAGTAAGTAQDDKKEQSRESPTDRVGDYPALTLPCIKFPASKKRRAVASSHHPNPLYMTVTLMGDEDPHKRCFHCVLTDCPVTNGALGSITPELLALLFAEPDTE